MTRVRRLFALRSRLADDGGFTIVEAVIAMGLAAILVTSLNVALGGGLAAARVAKRYQQATAIGNAAVERARDVAYAQLAMSGTDTDPAADPHIKSTCPTNPSPAPGARYFDPDGSGILKCEALASLATGASITPHVTTEAVNGLSFTVRRYVTWTDADTQGSDGKDYKRVAIIVEWQSGTKKGSYRASTLVTSARRGLSVVSFDLTPNPRRTDGGAEQAKKVVKSGIACPASPYDPAKCNRVIFAHTVVNLGRSDTYDLRLCTGPQTETPSCVQPDGVKYHRDLNGNGEYDPSTESAVLTNTTGNIWPDTGLVGANAPYRFLVEFNAPKLAGTQLYTMLAQSTADPALSETRTDELFTIDTPIDLVLYLHNRPTPPVGDTKAQIDLAMNGTAPTTTGLHNYSTDISATTPGRMVKKGPSADTEANTDKMVNWFFPLVSRATFKGAATLDISVINPDVTCALTGTFDAHLRRKPATGSGTIIKTTSSASAPLACPSRKVTIDLSATEVLVDGGESLELKLTVPNGAGNVDLSFAYDTTPNFKSVLKLPQVSVVAPPTPPPS